MCNTILIEKVLPKCESTESIKTVRLRELRELGETSDRSMNGCIYITQLEIRTTPILYPLAQKKTMKNISL